MVVSVKDGFKLIGVTVITFCAVFVCTFFLNFVIDAGSIKDLITEETTAIYNAQMASAKLCSVLAGGILSLIAVIMIFFYIKLYIDNHKCQLGVLKAMGYSDIRIASGFFVFGLSVLAGTVIGFGAGFLIMPTVYEGLTIEGLPEIKITFHASLVFFLILLPTAVFSLLSWLYGAYSLRRPALEMLRGKTEIVKKAKKNKTEKDRTFVKEMFFKNVSVKKAIAFLIAFAGFCVAAMVQMAVSMAELAPTIMAVIIFAIGAVLAFTTLFMAITSLINANVKNISIMKAFGYSVKECFLSVFAVYHIFAFAGFAVGTAYQYVLLSLVIKLFYKDVGAIPEYGFSVVAFFAVLAVFIVLYEAIMAVCLLKMRKISIKEIMTEN